MCVRVSWASVGDETMENGMQGSLFQIWVWVLVAATSRLLGGERMYTLGEEEEWC